MYRHDSLYNHIFSACQASGPRVNMIGRRGYGIRINYDVYMRKLIFGTTFISDFQRAELTEMWLRLLLHFNPDCDILLADTPADPSFGDFVPSLQGVHNHIVAEDGTLPQLQRGVNWITFTDNIGHLSMNGRDGWGRAFCRGIEIALSQNYDYVAHIEGDSVCRLAFDDVIAKMQRHNLGAISTVATKWNILETGLMFMECNYLREIDFLKKYDWRTAAKDERGQRPENKIEEALQGRLLYELWHGGRDENDEQFNLFELFEIPKLHFLTHAQHWALYHEFMRVHAPSLNWKPLFSAPANH